MFGMIGYPELLVILGIVVLLFGGSKLPELARSLGEAKREFEKSSSDDKPEVKSSSKREATEDSDEDDD